MVLECESVFVVLVVFRVEKEKARTVFCVMKNMMDFGSDRKIQKRTECVDMKCVV